MKAVVSQVNVQRAGIESISVGQVGIGPIHIGQLLIDNLHMGMSTDQVELRNFRITITLALSLDWWVNVHIPLDGDIGGNGTIDIGQPSITVPLGDVELQGPQSFSIDLPSVSLANVNASARPATDLQLGAAIAEQIQAKGVIAPAQGFTVAGLGFGSLSGAGIAVPAATTDHVTIGRVHGDALPVGQVAMTDLALPSAEVTDLVGGSLDVAATATGYAFSADAGIFRMTLHLTPSARAQMDELHVSGIQSTATIGRIEMNDVIAPYELLNLTLSQIGIDTIDIPSFGIS